MNQKKTRFHKLLLLPLLIAVLLFPTQALATDYSCTVRLPVEVQTIALDDDVDIPEGEVYTVQLIAQDEAPLPEETRLTVTDNGTVEFGPITYTKPGDYCYAVFQEMGETDFYTYDRTVYHVTVRVVNDDNGGLTSEIWAVRDEEEQKLENITFTNVYTPEEEPVDEGSSSASTSATPVKRDNKKTNTPKTGDSANLTLWTCLLAASALGIITVLVAFLKRSHNK